MQIELTDKQVDELQQLLLCTVYYNSYPIEDTPPDMGVLLEILEKIEGN